MNKLFIALPALLLIGTAHAALPDAGFNCNQLSVTTHANGTVLIKGQRATVKKFNDNFYEARNAAEGLTVSLNRNPDDTWGATFSGRNRANGVCAPTTGDASNVQDAAPRAVSREMAERICVSAVGGTVNMGPDRLKVLDVKHRHGETKVKVKVPRAQGPWLCTLDAEGKVKNVMFMGTEGGR